MISGGSQVCVPPFDFSELYAKNQIYIENLCYYVFTVPYVRSFYERK